MPPEYKPFVLALIPARSGSKSLAHKNIRTVAGKPLLAWSVEHALAAEKVDRTIVSTDSQEYAGIARQYGGEVPFLRPAALSGDDSTDLEAFEHALAWFKEHEGYVPDICVHLRPTCPVRRPGLIDEVVEILTQRPEIDSVRTVTEVLHTPYKMWRRSQNGRLAPLLTLDKFPEPWNEPRQKLPTTFLQTANVDAVRTRVILEQHSMTGQSIHGLVESELNDIDTESELLKVSLKLEGSAANVGDGLAEQSFGAVKTFCFDIDGVIAAITPGNDYNLAEPIQANIEVVNRLYEQGHRILLHTARGSMTGIDWRAITQRQMDRWGVRYHELHLGKPAADFYIDDRMVPLDQLPNLI